MKMYIRIALSLVCVAGLVSSASAFGKNYGLNRANPIHMRDCGGTKIRAGNITIAPLPLVLKIIPVSYTFGFDMNVTGRVPADARIDLKIQKVMNAGLTKFNLPLPCFNHLGTCHNTLYEMFNINVYHKISCQYFAKSAPKMECPPKDHEIPIGYYSARDVSVGDVIEIPPPLQKLIGLARGEFHLKLMVTDQTTDEMYLCVEGGVYAE